MSRNIDRIAQLVIKNGGKNILIHTIPRTQNWIVAQKIEEDKWSLTLCDPMKNVTFNLGVVSDEQHVKLWRDITEMEIENKTNNIKAARQLRGMVKNFINSRNDNYNYAKFTERTLKKVKTKKTKKWD